jgi:2-polyprenyl-3-methyl-5-hydroxy-6-metoxy-1,4-benzoquinol methylase
MDDMTALAGTTFFDTQAERWVGLYESRPAFRQRLDLFTQSLRKYVAEPGPILDFGCGPGVLSLAIASSGYQVTGMDGAPNMIEMARRESVRRGIANVSFDVMDANAFAIPKASFSGVVCSSVIEYVKDDARLVTDLVSVVKPGGHLLISVPHSASLFGFAEDCLTRVSRYRNITGRRHLAFSLRRYSRTGFARSLEAAGVRPVAFHYYEAPIPGHVGLALSRFSPIGVMLLVVGQKVA